MQAHPVQVVVSAALLASAPHRQRLAVNALTFALLALSERPQTLVARVARALQQQPTQPTACSANVWRALAMRLNLARPDASAARTESRRPSPPRAVTALTAV